jgi:hypothetical protein
MKILSQTLSPFGRRTFSWPLSVPKLVRLFSYMVASIIPALVARAQFAPASFESYVYYDRVTGGGIGQRIEKYNSDGTVSLILSRQQNPQQIGDSLPWIYNAPRSRYRTYTYVRNDSASGTLTEFDVGISFTTRLYFSEPKRAVYRQFPYDSEYIDVSGLEQMTNTSVRTFIGLGGTSIIGFVIDGTRGRWVLVRGIGPGLKAYGVSGVLADPQLDVIGPNGSRFGSMGSWRSNGIAQSSLTPLMAFVGAFALDPNADDAVFVLFLYPGVYSVFSKSASGAQSGEVLTEVYILP